MHQVRYKEKMNNIELFFPENMVFHVKRWSQRFGPIFAAMYLIKKQQGDLLCKTFYCMSNSTAAAALPLSMKNFLIIR